MKRTDRELNQMLDDAIGEIRQERLDDATVKTTTDRVWRRLTTEDAAAQAGMAPVERIRGCDDFQALIPAYLGGYLSSARALLLEDHTHECIPCRKALKESRAVRRGEVQAARPEMIKVAHRNPAIRWAIAAVLAVGFGLFAWPWVQQLTRSVGTLHTIVQAANGNVYRISENRTHAVTPGEKIAKGERIRTSKNAGAVVKLADGSIVEMRERSELSVSENTQGTTINLERGQIVVEAAKQINRHLYVATDDSLVSVTGTVFSVNSGTKGARVSVIEGEVQVDHRGVRSTLRPGDQVATHASIERVPVKEEVAWSHNSGKYAKVLDDLAALRKDIDSNVSRPGVRYSTRLLDLAPEGTALYVAIPNVSKMLAEANTILEERIQQNPELREWWDKEQAANHKGFNEIIDRIREFGSYLGPEIVLCAELNDKGEPDAPVVFAELSSQAGFETYLRGQLAELRAEGKKGPNVRLITDLSTLPAKASGDDFFVWMKDDLLVGSPRPAALSRLAGVLRTPDSNRFASSAFHAQLAELYHDGAGLVIAADLQRIVGESMREKAGSAHGSQAVAAADRLGLLNVKYFIAEMKEKDGHSSNRAVLSFTERKGMASWLAAPGPMGALEFISRDATVVASFVAEHPVSLVDDLLGALQTAEPGAWQQLKDFETQHGFDLRDDFAAPLGGEFVFAIDGPLLPIPAWKTVIEVNDQARLQQSFERTVTQLNEWAAGQGKQGLEWQRAESGDRVFYTLKSLDYGVEACYTFAYGYLIAAPTRTLVERAIQYRDSSISLLQSTQFKATLPEDKQANFSAMFYYNIGPAVAPLVKQGIRIPKGPMGAFGSLGLTKPTLAYVYSQGDRFTLSANTEDGPIGLTPSMLLGLPGGPFGPKEIVRPKEIVKSKELVR